MSEAKVTLEEAAAVRTAYLDATTITADEDMQQALTQFLAARPQAWTAEEIHAAIMAQGDTDGGWEEFANGVVRRLASPQPTEQPAQPAESQPIQVYATDYEKVRVNYDENGKQRYNYVQFSQERLIPLSEHTRIVAEAEAKGRREAIEEVCKWLDSDCLWTPAANLIRTKFLPQPKPEERVTLEQRGNLWYVRLDRVQQYAGKESTAKALHYGLIAQLKGGTK